MNVYDEAFEALRQTDLGEGATPYAKAVGDRLQSKYNALRGQLLTHQMKDIEARMYDKGAELPVIKALLELVSKADLNTRLMVHDGLSDWLDLLDER